MHTPGQQTSNVSASSSSFISALSWQLFMVCGGIPGSSSRRSLSPASFMGTGGRTSQMVFLRNYYVLIHCEGACWLLPLFPSYWEVTKSGLPRGGSVWETERREGDWWVMWKVVVFKVLCSECQTVSYILPWTLEDMREWAEGAGEMGKDWMISLERLDCWFDAGMSFCWDGPAEVCLKVDCQSTGLGGLS